MADLPPSFQKKKIHVNAASLVDLKAALFRKQQEVKQGTGGVNSKTSSKRVSEKTASIWRKKSAKKSPKDVPNTGNGTSTQTVFTSEEELDLARSRAALEAKAALYDRLSSRAAGGQDISSSSDEDDDKPRIMVDFQRKIYEQVIRQKNDAKLNKSTNSDNSKQQESTNVQPVDVPADNSDEEWVDYTDSLGRSRRCLKKDLPQMQQLDKQMDSYDRSSRSSSPDLLSEDMRRERERQKWEEEAYRQTTAMMEEEQRGEYEGAEEYQDSKKEVPIHYQSVQQREIRNVGIGYYAFDTDEQKREDQMKMLNKLRENTKDQQVKRERIKEKRKALLEAKLAKIRQRKLKNKGEDSNYAETKLSSEIADFDFENYDKQKDDKGSSTSTTEGPSTSTTESLEELIQKQVTEAREKSESEDRKRHKRPWDRGKAVDPIRKQKKELQEERLTEFAPPLSYRKDTPNNMQPPTTANTTQSPNTPNISLPPPTTSMPPNMTLPPISQGSSSYPYLYPPFPPPYPLYVPQFIPPPFPNSSSTITPPTNPSVTQS